MEQPQQGGFPPSGKGGCVSCLHRERVPFAASEDPGVCQGQWAASHWRKDRAWGYRSGCLSHVEGTVRLFTELGNGKAWAAACLSPRPPSVCS